MSIIDIVALMLYAVCVANHGEVACHVNLNATVTEYVPELGTPMQCMEPCDMTAFMVPVTYGETAACGPGWEFNTRVTIFTPWGEKIVRYCQDRGGGVEDDHVDIAMPLTENGFYYSSWDGGWPVIWEGFHEVDLQQAELERDCIRIMREIGAE